MPLESGSWIGDLVITNPQVGDPVGEGWAHLNLIKSVLQTALPNWTNATTGELVATADEIDAGLALANSAIQTIAGNPPDASENYVPQDGDYDADLIDETGSRTVPAVGETPDGTRIFFTDAEAVKLDGIEAGATAGVGSSAIDDLTDVDTTTDPVATNDLLVYDGTNFVPFGMLAGYIQYDTWNSGTGDTFILTNDRTNGNPNEIPSALGTVQNVISGGFGWQYTAQVRQLVTATLTCELNTDASVSDDRIAWELNAADSTIPTDNVASCVAFSNHTHSVDVFDRVEVTQIITANIIMVQNDTLTPFWAFSGATQDASRTKITLSALQLPDF